MRSLKIRTRRGLGNKPTASLRKWWLGETWVPGGGSWNQSREPGLSARPAFYHSSLRTTSGWVISCQPPRSNRRLSRGARSSPASRFSNLSVGLGQMVLFSVQAWSGDAFSELRSIPSNSQGKHFHKTEIVGVYITTSFWPKLLFRVAWFKIVRKGRRWGSELDWGLTS